MIIVAKIKDNYYMQVIKKYFNDGGPFVATNYKSEEEYKGFLKYVEVYNDFRFKQNDKQKLRQIIEQEIKENFINYLNNINSDWKTPAFNLERIQRNKEHLLGQLKITIADIICGTSKNGTWLYYIDFIRQYVIL